MGCARLLVRIQYSRLMYFVYFLRSLRNGKIYTGKTSQLPEIRLNKHNRGMNKFTAENIPFELVYFEKYICKDDATNREIFYKSGFGRKIRDIILKEVASAKGGSACG
ncbi:MAG: GIY-YIG nuclease family protein [Microgenomates group bacterium]